MRRKQIALRIGPDWPTKWRRSQILGSLNFFSLQPTHDFTKWDLLKETHQREPHCSRLGMLHGTPDTSRICITKQLFVTSVLPCSTLGSAPTIDRQLTHDVPITGVLSATPSRLEEVSCHPVLVLGQDCFGQSRNFENRWLTLGLASHSQQGLVHFFLPSSHCILSIAGDGCVAASSMTLNRRTQSGDRSRKRPDRSLHSFTNVGRQLRRYSLTIFADGLCRHLRRYPRHFEQLDPTCTVSSAASQVRSSPSLIQKQIKKLLWSGKPLFFGL